MIHDQTSSEVWNLTASGKSEIERTKQLLVYADDINTSYFLSVFLTFLLNRPLLPCGVEGFLLVNLLDNW
jgi:hypothetical protein